MSVEAITWAMKQPIESSSAKFVLVVLANCASGDTFTCYPSIAYIAEATAQDRKTVIRNMRRLREWGLIEDTGERKGETAQVVVYRLRGADLFASLPKSERFQKRNSSQNGTGPKTPPNSPNFDPKEAQKRDTEPSEPSEPGKIEGARAGGTLAGALAAGVGKALGPRNGLTSMHPDVIAAATEGVTADMVLEAHAAYPDKPVAYALAIARSQLRDSSKPTSSGHRGGAPPARSSARDDTSKANYVGTPADELPIELR